MHSPCKEAISYFYNLKLFRMIDVILFLLVSLGLIFLYFELKTYRQQKDYIKNERISLKKLRRANLAVIKPKFIYSPTQEQIKN